jgi:hypothetical protein
MASETKKQEGATRIRRALAALAIAATVGGTVAAIAAPAQAAGNTEWLRGSDLQHNEHAAEETR